MRPTTHRPSPVEDRLPPDVRLRRVRYEPVRADAWRALLSAEERERLDGYGVEKRRREFLLGRVAARELLSEVTERAPKEVLLKVAADGAVEVGNAQGLRLSISHAGEEAVAAVARRTIGVDLEPIQPRPERLHRFLLQEDECPLLQQRTLSTDAAFTLCWALKEAVLKALRCGLRRSPKTVRIAALKAEAGAARLHAHEWDATFEAHFSCDEGQWLVVAYGPGHAS